MDSLLEELIVDIFHRVGQRDFRSHTPFISRSEEIKTDVFTLEVLSVVDLTEYVLNSFMAKKDSIYRHLFSSCVQHGNVVANQLETLQILSKEGHSEVALLKLFH